MRSRILIRIRSDLDPLRSEKSNPDRIKSEKKHPVAIILFRIRNTDLWEADSS
jgi:hypothetical protein